VSEISNVLVVDRQLLCRSGLAAILRSTFKRCQVETFGDIGQALAALAATNAPTLLAVDGGIDLNTAEIGGIHGLRTRHPNLALAVIDWRHERRLAFKAIEAGAHGYIPKDLDQTELVRALKLVMAGQIYIPTTVSEMQVDEHRTKADGVPAPPLPDLTERQREVLEHMSLGKSNKEIARALCISESTVKVHVAAAFRLLGVHNRVGAVARLQSRSGSGSYEHGISAPVLARRHYDQPARTRLLS